MVHNEQDDDWIAFDTRNLDHSCEVRVPGAKNWKEARDRGAKLLGIPLKFTNAAQRIKSKEIEK